MFKKVFICYTMRDAIISEEYLIKLNNILKKYCKPYIDFLHNDSINKQGKVERELINSNFLILLETENFLNSKWVIHEIRMAKTYKIPILKIRDIYNSYNIKRILHSIICS